MLVSVRHLTIEEDAVGQERNPNEGLFICGADADASNRSSPSCKPPDSRKSAAPLALPVLNVIALPVALFDRWGDGDR